MKEVQAQQQFISFKFDFSLVQSKLSDTLTRMQNQINALTKQTSNLENQLGLQYQKINDRLTEVQDRVEEVDGNCLNKLRELSNRNEANLMNQDKSPIQKTPTEILDDMEKRINLPLKQNQPRRLSINYNPSRSERVSYEVNVQEQEGKDESSKSIEDNRENENNTERKSKTNRSKNMDKKFFDIYSNIMEKVQKQITEARAFFKQQINEWKDESGKLYDELSKTQKLNEDDFKKEKAIKNDSLKMIEQEKRQVEIAINTEKQIPQNQGFSKKSIGKCRKEIEKSKKTIKEGQVLEENQTGKEIINQKNQILSTDEFQRRLEENQRNMMAYINQLKDRIEEMTKSNSITVDHVVGCKKDVKELFNQTDSLKLQLTAIADKSNSAENQLSLLAQASNDFKNKFKILEPIFSKIAEDDGKSNEMENGIKQEDQDGVNEGKKNNDMFRDSRSSFRSSITAGLGPLRPSNIIKQNNNRIQSIEENMKKMASKLSTFIERVNKMEDEKKKFGQFQSSLLPKIDKENKSNVNHFEIIKKDMRKINEDLGKTNERLSQTKEKLSQLYDAHAEIPMKIQDLYIKLREYNQIQQDRLIQLIKELINRMLIDPFDNNFTNTLKREINVKFLQIKHQYNSILKEIGYKLDGRAEQTELVKVKEHFEENIIEVKTLLNKKCETEDFKKGVKYLEGKIKDVFQFSKNQTSNLYNEQKKYIGVRKQ